MRLERPPSRLEMVTKLSFSNYATRGEMSGAELETAFVKYRSEQGLSIDKLLNVGMSVYLLFVLLQCCLRFVTIIPSSNSSSIFM